MLLKLNSYFMLSDSPLLKPLKGPVARTVKTGRNYSDRQKIECATTFIMLGGNVALTSAALKIPEQTIFMWKKSQWWQDLIGEIKQQERIELSTRLKKIVDSSWDVVEDRLKQGDFIYDQKAQRLVRKPVSMKDAAKVAVDAAVIRDKQNLGGSITVDGNALEEKLTKLAKAFSDLSKGIVHIQDVEDINFKEVDNEKLAPIIAP